MPGDQCEFPCSYAFMLGALTLSSPSPRRAARAPRPRGAGGGAGHRGRRRTSSSETAAKTHASPSRFEAGGGHRRIVMERPDRVIVDLPEVTFHLPAETGPQAGGPDRLLPLRPVRAGPSRIVIDLAQPALSRARSHAERADGAVAPDHRADPDRPGALPQGRCASDRDGPQAVRAGRPGGAEPRDDSAR